MDEIVQISNLIGEIYDAALNSEHWDYVLERSCEFFKAAAGGFGVFDQNQKKVSLSKMWGYEPQYMLSYAERYSKINVLAIAGFGIVKAGDVVTNSDLMPLDEWHASRAYPEWCKPQGLDDTITAILEKSAAAFAALSVVRHERQGLFDEEARRRMRLLLPHFHRAVLIGKVIDLHKVEAASLADTLDGLAAAMLLVDANGRIVHSNAAGQTMLSEGTVLRGTGGKLSAVDPRGDAALQEIIMNAENGDVALG